MIDEILLKKINYQSRHRGCKESDFIFIRFADKYLPTLIEDELKLYIELLQESDLDIMAWLMHQQPFPEKYLLLKDKLFAVIKSEK